MNPKFHLINHDSHHSKLQQQQQESTPIWGGKEQRSIKTNVPNVNIIIVPIIVASCMQGRNI